ncbi:MULTISPECIES: NAD(P)/FAD-dependent oxidoreductase [unclassified Streptomyces]|uniref:FAD-dependent oxidoreductase n=1 Tax=unclassified Streptomyces TaxID=2593676 RepID=UPI000BF743B4|nr:FAD-dependent monooxygenase [Streptomyces sp. Ru87]PGH50915.1 monooxygenase [Streptomyces sp. Ru87]
MADQRGLTTDRARHAVVIGGSVAGLLAAAVLAEHAERVTVVERDRFPEGPEARAGVPQGRHIHVLLEGGQKALEQLLPGLCDEMRAAGSPEVGMPGDMVQWQGGRWYRRTESTAVVFTGTRPLMEHAIRRRVLADSRIRTVEGTEAVGLAGDARRVRGVLLRERGTTHRNNPELLEADLVVDASGRGSRAPRWLAELGAEPPQEETIDTGLAYATRLYRDGSRGKVADALGYYVVPNPAQTYGAVVLPVEGDGLHLVTLSGLRADQPPTDNEAFEAFARKLPHPIVTEWLSAAEPRSSASAYRRTANVRRRYDRPGVRPSGFLATGDALCTFNPIYGQGMSVAALSALALRDALADRRHPATTRRVQKALLAASNTAWDICAGADKSMPGATGNAVRFRAADRPASWYLRRVQAHAPGNPVVGAAFRAVLGLTAPVGALFAPRVLRAVLFGSVPAAPTEPPLGRERAADAEDAC